MEIDRMERLYPAGRRLVRQGLTGSRVIVALAGCELSRRVFFRGMEKDREESVRKSVADRSWGVGEVACEPYSFVAEVHSDGEASPMDVQRVVSKAVRSVGLERGSSTPQVFSPVFIAAAGEQSVKEVHDRRLSSALSDYRG